MWMTNNRWTSLLMCVVLWSGAASVMAQNPPDGGQGGGRPGGPGGRPDMEEMRKRFADRMRELMGASPEEWAVLQPKIEKVQQLQRESSSDSLRRIAFGMLFSRERNPGDVNRPPSDRGGDRGGREPSGLETKARDLQTTIENKDAKPDEIKAKLTAIRESRSRAKVDLVKAQEELRELCTVKQEALLVIFGILE